MTAMYEVFAQDQVVLVNSIESHEYGIYIYIYIYINILREREHYNIRTGTPQYKYLINQSTDMSSIHKYPSIVRVMGLTQLTKYLDNEWYIYPTIVIDNGYTCGTIKCENASICEKAAKCENISTLIVKIDAICEKIKLLHVKRRTCHK